MSMHRWTSLKSRRNPERYICKILQIFISLTSPSWGFSGIIYVKRSFKDSKRNKSVDYFQAWTRIWTTDKKSSLRSLSYSAPPECKPSALPSRTRFLLYYIPIASFHTYYTYYTIPCAREILLQLTIGSVWMCVLRISFLFLRDTVVVH